jgi:tetratricopeptide (TPR) repeat protein
MQVDLEDLHRQASGHYLKGEFVNAMAAWRQVLDLQPDDERAREGIRLCEQLDGGVDPSPQADSAGSPQAAVADAPLAAPGSPPQVAPADVPQSAPEVPPQADSASSPQATDDPGELDLEVECDLSAPEPAASEPAESVGDGEPMLDLSQLGEETPAVTEPAKAPPEVAGPTDTPPQVTEPAEAVPVGEPVESPEQSAEEAAAEELRRRIGDLLSEARSLAEQGVVGPALAAVDRVLILDEENEEAIALRESLQEATAEPQPKPEPSEDAPALELDLEPAEGEGLPLEPSPEQADGAAQPSEPPSGAEQPADGQAEAQPAPSAAPAGKQRSAPSMPGWLQDRRVMLGAGVALVVIAVAVGFMMIGGGEDPNLEPLVASDTAGVEPTTEPAEPAAATEPDPTPGGHDMEALMREAESAFETENYAAAVIAYDRVLKQVPDHAEAGVKMKVAAERYREQQQRQERWDNAVTAFEEGNYAEALRAFYRMPNDEYEADIDRYKVNGWYNLGVAALQAKDCGRAIEHFEEALALAPRDEGVLVALELAELCRGSAVLQDVRRLQYRALND